MTVETLQALLDSGGFHSATHRKIGRHLHGIHIYRQDPQAERGYSLDFIVLEDDPNWDQAMEMLAQYQKKIHPKRLDNRS